MAALTKDEVTIHESWFTDGLGGVKHVGRRVTMELSSHGNATAANSIPATALTLRSIVDASAFVKEGNTNVELPAISVDGSLLLFGNASGNVTTLTGNYTGVVVGPTEV